MTPRDGAAAPRGSVPPGRPRVLLVDDDASTRLFVAMALEDMDVELRCAADVPQALAALRADGPVQLLLTDLMMPGETGIDLLRHLAAAPALRGDARLVVLSARGDADTREQLARLGLWRQLHKPVSVAELQACVSEALEGPVAGPSGPSGRSDDPAGGAKEAVLTAAERDAVERHFGGEHALFLSFRASCALQFEDDLKLGSAAVERGDAPALRRLAHSLKSILATLGHEALSASARRLEAAAAAGDWGAARPLWTALRDGLRQARAAQPSRQGPPPAA